MFVQVVVPGPDGVVEVEVSEEDGVGEEGLDRRHRFNGGVVGVVVDVEDEEGMGRGSDFEAHDPRGGDDVGPELAGPFGAFGGDVHHDVGMTVLGSGLWEDGLPVRVFGAAVDIEDGGTLGHLGISPNASVVGFLNENKVSWRTHSRGYRKDGMSHVVAFVCVL